MPQPVILVDPHPRSLSTICDTGTRRRLAALGSLVIHEEGPMPDVLVERHLEEAVLIFGQTAMPEEQLRRARRLRAIINVETNYFVRARGAEPVPLEELLSASRVVFAFAGATSENQRFLGREAFERMQPGSAFLLMSRGNMKL